MVEQIILIETKLSYLEDMIKTLNTLVIEQGARIERLEAKKEQLEEQVASLLSSGQEMPHSRPPHY
ncbi:MAG: SlyX family protein [Spirochaetia bacterium]|nr:SlyX family protein [Spirochaetia bacterium]